LKLSQDGKTQEQFLRVGLGTVDLMPIIENGDIQAYPTKVFGSKDQVCTFTHKSKGRLSIHSELQAPTRTGLGSEFTKLEF
jgi:hypothetical protein